MQPSDCEFLAGSSQSRQSDSNRRPADYKSASPWEPHFQTVSDNIGQRVAPRLDLMTIICLKFGTVLDDIGQKKCPQSVRMSKTVKGCVRKKSPKFGSKYWESKMFRHHNSSDPTTLYYVKLQWAGRRETFCLRSNIRAEAAVTARDIYMELRTVGWDFTLEKRKPEAFKKTKATTVGELIAAVESVYLGQARTVADYGRSFRRIVADIFAVERDEKRYGHVNGGRNQWIDQVNAIELADLTPAMIEAWRTGYINRAGDDLKKRQNAIHSSNAFLRCARSLFNVDRLKAFNFDPPIQSPFRGIKLSLEGDMRYRSELDIEAMVAAAALELPGKPELFKAFLLLVGCGLRRGELDNLEWNAINWNRSSVHVGPTQYLHVKSQRSIGDVDIDPEILAILRGYHARKTQNFILESDSDPMVRVRYSRYRCRATFDHLIAWIRTKGVKARNPLHMLRKEFGSLVNQRHGIHAASAALRRADIGITARHYVAKKTSTAVGLGGLLGQQEKIVSMPLPSPSLPTPSTESVPFLFGST